MYYFVYIDIKLQILFSGAPKQFTSKSPMVRPPWNRKADGPGQDVATEAPAVTTTEVPGSVETDKCTCTYGRSSSSSNSTSNITML